MKKASFLFVVVMTAYLAVVQAQNSQNFNNCKYGYANCDASQLTAQEQAEVAVAARARNFTACRFGYPNCDASRLTTQEQAEVAVAARARNFNACKFGYAGCDRSSLTTSEAAQIPAPQTVVTPVIPSVPGFSGVAENGSYYGQLNANGVPKTVHVNGYFRKDGTYVRGHYRSAPGTNPPRIGSHR